MATKTTYVTQRVSELTDEQLAAELARRKKLKAETPTPLATPNFDAVIATVKEYIDSLAKRGEEPKDCKQWMFEAAVEAVYGREIWQWISSRDR